MPVIVATATPLPEHREALKEALVTAIAATHAEDGCELYALHENADGFVFIEQWSSMEALAVHGRSAAFRELSREFKEKLAGPLDVLILEPVPAGDPAKGQLRA